MKILLTNDDGIAAPGISALHQAVQTLGTAIVVAPKNPQSGIAHQITAHTPIEVIPLSQDWVSVDGTPADCARIGLKMIVPDADWLISGINAGSNLGTDIYQSGTVAAAREATILGFRAIAVSQYISPGNPVDWQATQTHARHIITRLMRQSAESGHFWNINLPHPVAEDAAVAHQMCPPDTHPHHYSYRREGNHYIFEGDIHRRPYAADTDVAVCYGGKASISKIRI